MPSAADKRFSSSPEHASMGHLGAGHHLREGAVTAIAAVKPRGAAVCPSAAICAPNRVQCPMAADCAALTGGCAIFSGVRVPERNWLGGGATA